MKPSLGISKGVSSDRRNASSGSGSSVVVMKEDEKTFAVTAATPLSSATPESSIVEHSAIVGTRSAVDTSRASLPHPARLKEDLTDSVARSSSCVHSDSASNSQNEGEEDDLGGAEEMTPSNPSSQKEGQPNDLLKYIRQRNALYSRRKYYKRKQELERLEEMKHQLEVRNEALRTDNAQLERWMQLIQRQLPGDLLRSASATSRASLQPRRQEQSSQLPSQYSTAVANRPFNTGIHDSTNNSIRASDLRQQLLRAAPSSSMNDLLLQQAVRSGGILPRSFGGGDFNAAPLDIRRLLSSHSLTQPPSAANMDLAALSMDATPTLSHLLSHNRLPHRSSAVNPQLLPSQLLSTQLLTNLRDDRAATAAFLDHARRKEEDQLRLLQLLQQQQRQSSLDVNPTWLGPLSQTPRATALPTSSQDLLLRQLLQTKQQEEEALLRQLASRDDLWQHHRPPPNGPPPRR